MSSPEDAAAGWGLSHRPPNVGRTPGSWAFRPSAASSMGTMPNRRGCTPAPGSPSGPGSPADPVGCRRASGSRSPAARAPALTAAFSAYSMQELS